MSLSFGGRSVLARFLGFVWGLGMWLLLEIPSYFEEFQVVLRVSDTFIMMHVQSSCNTFIYDIVHYNSCLSFVIMIWFTLTWIVQYPCPHYFYIIIYLIMYFYNVLYLMLCMYNSRAEGTNLEQGTGGVANSWSKSSSPLAEQTPAHDSPGIQH